MLDKSEHLLSLHYHGASVAVPGYATPANAGSVEARRGEAK